MPTEIVVALISALGVIVAALITAYFTYKAATRSSVSQNAPSRSNHIPDQGSSSTKCVLAGRQVKVATGRKTQTINVFDSTNIEGNYEQVYRIADPQKFVTKDFLLQNASSLQDLDRLLVQRGARQEGPRSSS